MRNLLTELISTIEELKLTNEYYELDILLKEYYKKVGEESPFIDDLESDDAVDDDILLDEMGFEVLDLDVEEEERL